jgi:subtilisin family serine protease
MASHRLGMKNGFLALYLWSALLIGLIVTTGAGGLGAQESQPLADVAGDPAADNRAEHLGALGVSSWHKAGFRGQGTAIAVLDTGFRGYRAQLGKALPERVTVRSFRKDGILEARDSQHGVLVAEVLHALAPQARLLLANWEPDDPQSFLSAVAWARQQGARILSCSLIMPSWSDGEGGGAVHEALQRLIGTGSDPGDMLFFACAGNTAQRHWSGRFQPDAFGLHQWSTGRTANGLRPWGEERVAVELYGPIASHYDLQVIDTQNRGVVGQATVRWGFAERLPALAPTRRRPNGGCAVVRFLPRTGHAYEIRLHGGWNKDPQDKFHLVILGGTLDQARYEGSIPFPGDGASVLTVGAVNWEGQRQDYSSCGPNSKRPKPDFVAPVPFVSACRERPFGGTSAAAPQGAALAALWWSRHPAWTPEQVRQAMRRAARDLGPPGHDCETGYGLIRLPHSE